MASPVPNSEPDKHFDLLVLGGGINGAGIAREAASRGYTVCLCDGGDFGGGTSSASTKLIHGGLRYLEHFEFRLVREALREREVLWKMAPHIIRPMRFVLPHHKGLRPKWILRLGLFLYDNLGGRKLLPPTRSINLSDDPAGVPLKDNYKKAFEYSDCWVEDSRLVILNLREAQQQGADIRPRTPVERASFEGGQWKIQLGGDKPTRISASVVVNAAGPWVDQVLATVFGINDANNVRLVRGSHIVVRKKFDHDRAYIFQNADDRIIFAIPYEDDFTLIGTTDSEQENLEDKPKISESEIDYLCEMANEYFREPITKEDIVWTYSGIRPLYDDGASKAQEATRDYVIRAETAVGDGTLLNIFGGKITTFRMLSMAMMKEVESLLGIKSGSLRSRKHFPGGGFPVDGFDDLVNSLCKDYPFMEDSVLRRLARLYGTDAHVILGSCHSLEELGKDFGAGLYEAEVKYLRDFEWARNAEDILYRRTKLGLKLSEEQRASFAEWLANQTKRLPTLQSEKTRIQN